jgi:hypothetical protein
VFGVIAAITAPSALRADAQDAPVSYDARAAADGLRLALHSPGLFLATLFDGGAPVAQAHSNDLGASEGFAAMPAPGDTFATLGTLMPLLGLPALPPYPLQANASNPANPESTANAGAYVVSASGRDNGAKGSVTAGVNAGGNEAAYLEVSASTGVDPDTGEVVATSRAHLQGLSLLGLVSIGKVEASAKVTGGPHGDPVAKSSFDVEGLSIAGLPLAVTSQGVQLLGPAGAPLPDLQLAQLLAPLGITFNYLKATTIEDGVISAGLEITIPSGLPQPYDMTLTVTLGRASASADIAALSAPSDLGGGDVGGTIDSPVYPPIDSPVYSPIDSGSVDVAGPVAQPQVGPTSRTVSNVGPLEASAVSFYIVLVAAAIVALLSAALIRRFGVKLAWTS